MDAALLGIKGVASLAMTFSSCGTKMFSAIAANAHAASTTLGLRQMKLLRLEIVFVRPPPSRRRPADSARPRSCGIGGAPHKHDEVLPLWKSPAVRGSNRGRARKVETCVTAKPPPGAI